MVSAVSFRGFLPAARPHFGMVSGSHQKDEIPSFLTVLVDSLGLPSDACDELIPLLGKNYSKSFDLHETKAGYRNSALAGQMIASCLSAIWAYQRFIVIENGLKSTQHHLERRSIERQLKKLGNVSPEQPITPDIDTSPLDPNQLGLTVTWRYRGPVSRCYGLLAELGVKAHAANITIPRIGASSDGKDVICAFPTARALEIAIRLAEQVLDTADDKALVLERLQHYRKLQAELAQHPPSYDSVIDLRSLIQQMRETEPKILERMLDYRLHAQDAQNTDPYRHVLRRKKSLKLN